MVFLALHNLSSIFLMWTRQSGGAMGSAGCEKAVGPGEYRSTQEGAI
jgi:hypothetical protein